MKRKIAIIGLGYAGLHTALAFGLVGPIVGYDIDQERVKELKEGIDRHGDFSSETIKKTKINFTTNPEDLKDQNFYIIIVPTPIKKGNEPDFDYLISASELVGHYLKKGDIVVYESTVYPGATEEVCLPILTEESGLKFGEDFSLGYSPERVNPGDTEHSFDNTVKVVSGSDPKTLDIIAQEYKNAVSAGVYKVPNIKTAEAVKIVENIQRDTNIALVNELSKLFHSMDVDTEEVIKAAQTKWNFLAFHPGLVGGHCIGVDPYYLLYKANELGEPLKIIDAARNVNEQMSKFVAQEAVRLLAKNKAFNSHTNVALLGLTFKENYDDIRNSKVADLGKELESYGINVFYHDPLADPKDVEKEYGFKLTRWEDIPKVAAVIVAVGHDQFKKLKPTKYLEKLKENGILMDLKAILNQKEFEDQKITFWRL
jgi:UDP-N-acetyl-D-galactosamine dehydrogenase